MKDEQLISVLMSIYKECVPRVSQAFDSIKRQTYQNLEIVIMLDCPEREDMKVYLEQISNDDPRVKYYINEKNLGLLASLNLGIALCHGEFVCRMDEDDIAEPDRIEKQIKFIKRERVDLVGSYTRLIDMEGKITGEIRRFPTRHKYLCQYLRYANAVPHPTWIVRKAVYEKLNGYRNIPCVDDYDFLIRVYLNGYKMGVVPEPLLRYRINQKGMTQKNIASQKIASLYLARQISQKQIFPVDAIAEYRRENKIKEIRLMNYYSIGKKWRNGEKIAVRHKIKMLFNRYNFIEIRQRLVCRWIVFKDGRYGNH